MARVSLFLSRLSPPFSYYSVIISVYQFRHRLKFKELSPQSPAFVSVRGGCTELFQTAFKLAGFNRSQLVAFLFILKYQCLGACLRWQPV